MADIAYPEEIEGIPQVTILTSRHTPYWIDKPGILIANTMEKVAALRAKERLTPYFLKIAGEAVEEMDEVEKEQVRNLLNARVKIRRLYTTVSSDTSLQEDMQNLVDNYTQAEIIDLAKKGDTAAKILVLKALYKQATTVVDKLKVVAKYTRLLDWSG